MKYLELLAPAKDTAHGIAAINHGADAVYIGAPMFGARVAASNSLEDLEQLVRYAHIFGSKVFATVNTLLFDDELESANRMIHQLYNMGIDAIILQDLGLLKTDLPPVELHASTQTHNYSVERVQFLESVGFKRIILAREASLEQMRQLRESVRCDLEAFVQGALCVSFSGQCYMSQYLNERSGNRGCCSQPCRSSYDLLDHQGKVLKRDAHLLSLKDFSAAKHIASMVDAGITSFKIEGRLKDISYVKNVTAYYRQRLDSIMSGHDDWCAASQGTTVHYFTPDLERTFNRGFTDYFLTLQGGQKGRQKMASMATQKSMGKRVGKVGRIEGKTLVINSEETFSNGDGICFFNARGELDGFNLNQAQRISPQASRVLPNRMPADLGEGAELWRNNDYAFEKLLSGKSAERHIHVFYNLLADNNRCRLTMSDGQGHIAEAVAEQEMQSADNAERMCEVWTTQLSKLGDTPFQCAGDVRFEGLLPFLPVSQINMLRRQVVDRMIETLVTAHRPQPTPLEGTEAHCQSQLDYRANILNEAAAQFYREHGAEQMEYGLEKSHDYGGKALMTTKYCLRYELGMCLKESATRERGALFIRNNKHLFELHFDCQRCEMQVRAKE